MFQHNEEMLGNTSVWKISVCDGHLQRDVVRVQLSAKLETALNDLNRQSAPNDARGSLK